MTTTCECRCYICDAEFVVCNTDANCYLCSECTEWYDIERQESEVSDFPCDDDFCIFIDTWSDDDVDLESANAFDYANEYDGATDFSWTHHSIASV